MGNELSVAFALSHFAGRRLDAFLRQIAVALANIGCPQGRASAIQTFVSRGDAMPQCGHRSTPWRGVPIVKVPDC